MKYIVSKNVNYTTLSTLDLLMHIETCVSLCTACIFYSEDLPDHGGKCSITRREVTPTVLDRLIAEDIITKAEALDLLLKGK